MKFAFSIPSIIAHTSSILLVGFSLSLITPILASDNPDECKTPKPPQLNTVADFISMGLFQMECEKDSQAAISSYTQAIKLNPKVTAPYYQRANAYFQIGNYKAAVKDYTEVINKNTGRLDSSDVAYWNRARAYEKLGEKRKAISDWTQVISKSQKSAEAYIRRASMYRDLGDKNNAIQDYKVADKILQQELNGVFGNGGMDSMYQEMLDQVRTELSQLGVSLPEPNLTTAKILKSIAEIEVQRALNSAMYNPQHPIIVKFDAQLQDLYEQLESTQPQPDKITAKALINNAAYEKMGSLIKERSQLTTKYNLVHPEIVLVDNQVKQLQALISRNKI
ncbi:MAG: tetratricopeptide repeat protein [Richelia sp. RM2_1_2]|nr:tetratricopeptide repeat protein [Richelia sp. SM1_7_0]NJN12319.1 tetratricopeptide repeat protein [Richelia sp. RM1_1_1]NJO31628.1 tetratricopeptide repeat protein [Richelia sp. SL_2_1]NJO63425.1 tetratricopeptide repeat protein [Richelia sp. RM2_1_2]